MSTRSIPFMLAAAAFLFLTEPVNGQEVNSDVNIPIPRELAVGTRTISGILVGLDLLGAEIQILGGPSAQGPITILVEGAVREELGDFMTSLLVRARLVAFDVAPDPVADAGEKTSIPLSAGRTEHAASVKQR